jgi:hypothetical protein
MTDKELIQEKVNSMETWSRNIITELEQFMIEYEPGNKQYNKNLLMVLNSLEKCIFTLEILKDRKYVFEFLDSAFFNKWDLRDFVLKRTMSNDEILMYLSFYFDDIK